MNRSLITLYGCFAVCLTLTVSFWSQLRSNDVQWLNVPPPPSKDYASFIGLGDTSFAYRINGLFIQNLGDSAGRIVNLNDYNYDYLSQWFFVQDHLDAHSNFTPYIAAFYYGALTEAENYKPVLDYLVKVGLEPEGEKWRWLAQAIYFYRFRLNDLDKALELARLLRDHKRQDLPNWTKMMPAYVMTQKGEKEAAFELLMEILSSSAENLHPNEVNATRDYICRNLIDRSDIRFKTLCKDAHIR